MNTGIQRSQKIVLLVSLVCFIVSMTQDAFTVNDYDGSNTLLGKEVFWMGSTAFLGGGLLEWLVWLANPLFFISIIQALRGHPRAPHIGLLASALAVWFGLWNDILAAENGRVSPIATHGIGYYLWAGSIVLWSMTLIPDIWKKDIAD